jgi:DNA-binding transcriptional ArsR family regulator
MKKYYEENRKINLKKVEVYTNQLKVMAHPVRFSILIMLLTNKKMTVTQIYKELEMDQTAISNHLKMLKAIDMVQYEKNGKNKYYFVNLKTLQKLGRKLNLIHLDSEKPI